MKAVKGGGFKGPKCTVKLKHRQNDVESSGKGGANPIDVGGNIKKDKSRKHEFGKLEIKDAEGMLIGTWKEFKEASRDAPMRVINRIGDDLVITPDEKDKKGEAVEFELGAARWSTGGKECKVKAWSPKRKRPQVSCCHSFFRSFPFFPFRSLLG